MTEDPLASAKHYEIVSVRRAAPPSGLTGSDWHQYVISFDGNDTVNGYQQGNPASVRRAVEEIVAQLNERHAGKRGRVNLVPTPKEKTSK